MPPIHDADRMGGEVTAVTGSDDHIAIFTAHVLHGTLLRGASGYVIADISDSCAVIRRPNTLLAIRCSRLALPASEIRTGNSMAFQTSASTPLSSRHGNAVTQRTVPSLPTLDFGYIPFRLELGIISGRLGGVHVRFGKLNVRVMARSVAIAY